MKFATLLFCAILSLNSATRAPAAEPAAIESTIGKWLAEPILETEKALSEVQAFCASRVAPLPAPTSREAWETAAERIREEDSAGGRNLISTCERMGLTPDSIGS